MDRNKIHFGDFELDVETGELWKQGQRLKLPPKPLRVLALLASSPGRLVTRETIREQVWGSETFVDFEHGLNFCIREIRSVLGDDAKRPYFIETLPRRGYRFVGTCGPERPVVSDSEVERPNATANASYEHYSKARKSFSRAGKEALEEAGQEFEKALAVNPGYALAHSGLGATLALRTVARNDPDNLEKAKAHLQRALELDPELGEPYPWLCYVYTRQNQLDWAIEAGHRAVQLQPDLVHAHYFLGLAYFGSCETRSANYQPAANHLLDATRVGPKWQPSWFVLAFVALLNGDYEHAGQYARKLLEQNSQIPGFPFIGAELVLAAVEVRRLNMQAARKVLVDFLEALEDSDHMYRDSMGAVAACMLGDTEMRDGKATNALAAYRRAWHAAQEHPRMIAQRRISARAQAGLASAYAAMGEYDRAKNLLSKAVQLARESESLAHGAAGASLAELFWSLGAACVRTNDTSQALEMLTRAVSAGWRDAAWLETDPEVRPLSDRPEFLALSHELRCFPKIDFSADQVAGQ